MLPTMSGTLRWIVAGLCVLSAGTMLVHGIRALMLSETERTSVEQIQALGAWARLFVDMGIHPLSTATSCFFIVYGASWIACTGAFAQGHGWARWAVALGALGSLWFMGLGTLVSLLVLGMIFFVGR